MAKKKVKLSAKQFFTITVLSSTLLVMLFLTTGIMQSPTRTTSDATGGNYGSLNQCNFKYNRAGGVALYNKVNGGGGYRVICVKFRSKISDPVVMDLEVDKHLGSIQSGQTYYDIWNFNNKTDSVRIRANPWCQIHVELFNGGLGENRLWYKMLGDNVTGNKYERTFNLPKDKRDKATSIKMWSQCLKERIPS